QRDQRAPPEEPLPRDQVCGRRPEQEHGEVSDQARLQADHQRVAEYLVPELIEELADRNAQEDRDERQQQEGESDAGRDRGHRRERDPAHFLGSPNPACLSSCRPRFETSLFTKERASTRRPEELTIATW